MARVVVLGVDNSATARRAAQSAGALATAMGARLHVVSAFSSERTEVVGNGSDQFVVSEATKAEQVARDVAVSLRSDTL